MHISRSRRKSDENFYSVVEADDSFLLYTSARLSALYEGAFGYLFGHSVFTKVFTAQLKDTLTRLKVF